MKSGGVTAPTMEKINDIPVPKIEGDTLLEAGFTAPQLIRVPGLAIKTMYRLGIVQLIFGVALFCGMSLYLGLNFGDAVKRDDYFGNRCPKNYPTWAFFDIDEGYIIAAIAMGVIVSFHFPLFCM